MVERGSQDLTNRYEEREKLRQEIDFLEKDRYANVEQSASKAAQTNIGSVAEDFDDLIDLRARLAKIDEEISELESDNDPPDEDLPGASSVDEEPSIEETPEDDPPTDPWEDLTQRFDAQLAIARVKKPWELPVNALVLPVGVRGGMYGGLAKALQAEFGEKVWDEFLGHVETAVSTMTPEDPILITLPIDLGAKILPNAPEIEEGARYQIIAATPARPSRQNPDAEEFFPDIAARAIIELAVENRIGKLVIPLLSTGTGKQRGDLVVQNMVKAICDAIPETDNPLELVILTTRPTDDDDKSGVVTAAHDIVAMIHANRAQPFAADSASGEDTLGIEEEVFALAETLLLRNVETPLAVGVLGGWGSGKSFVMYLMLKRMMEIRSRRLDPDHCWGDNASAYVGHVYPIEFNAWTYAKSDLWASLMQTIFMELNQQLTMEKLIEEIDEKLLLEGSYWLELSRLGDKEQKALQSEVGQDAIAEAVKLWQEGKAPDRLWDVYNDVRSAENERMEDVVTQRNEKQNELANLQTVTAAEISEEARRNIWNQIITQSFSNVFAEEAKRILQENQNFSDEDLDDLSELGNKLKKSVPAASSMMKRKNITSLLKKQTPVILTAVFLFLVALLSILIRPLLAQLMANPQAATIISSLGGLGTVLLSIYRMGKDWLDRWGGGITTILNTAQGLLADEEQHIFDNRQQELQSEINSLDQQIDRHRQRLGIAGEFTSLYDFVSSRLAEGDYEERLGMLHQTQADLQELTNTLMIHGDNDLFKTQKQEFFPRGPARVVLFVDDLDRCPPDKVVEVLEAVQLLLRTKLFIVVLGLDTRYVTRALEKEYVDILTRMGDPSGLDYIEKIIQIPYRVRPIEPEKIGDFLKSQMEIVPELLSSGQNGGDGNKPVTPTGSVSPTDSENDDVKSTAADVPEGKMTEPATENGRSQATDTTPEPFPPIEIKFHQTEFNDLKTACVALGLTPRSIKRLINVLKLIKVFWFRTEQNKKQREIRTVINLLTLSARHPEIMAQIFHDIEMAYREERQSSENLSKFLELKTENEKLSSLAKQEKFETAVTNLKVEDITLADLGLETFHLIRSFSFVGDPTYNT